MSLFKSLSSHASMALFGKKDNKYKSKRLLAWAVIMLITLLVYMTILSQRTAYSASFPLYSWQDECVRSQLDKVTWVGDVDINYLEYTHTAPGNIGASGFVEISYGERDKKRLEPILNYLFDECYAKEVGEVELLPSSTGKIGVVIADLIANTSQSAKKILIEADMETHDLKYSTWD